ncbi:DUF2167 domain-containing protein [Massilia sp. BJB1822]|uniref:DUF2167 domain-containing protein n=1 Tax=Massilia sp. BJB1822 TaxID=2744470 RepID=UPI0015943125|nr:DUF2167 domain-containing protein [Massilia sp. BJB1822]NVE01506.1 DUF2167 domain-containing protein [Massilia sp. BJB1822]
MLKTLKTSLLCLALAATLPALAADAPAAPATAQQSPEQLLASFHYQQGKITLPGDIATLDLPPSFRYLPPDDAARLLTQGWGNPPGLKSLGMVLPVDVNPLSAEGWGVIITYDKDGHVKDDDADSIDYAKLLKEMQEGIEEANAERKKQGYHAMHLRGWAEQPSYDKASHKLYWAKELSNDTDSQNSLNYNIRVLGREGVLVLNAVAGMEQIKAVKAEMQKVTAFTDFTAGNRYADFNASTDKVAEYGLAALVAGGVAGKLGLFGKLLALLVAFKKLIFVGAAALVAGIAKFFGRKRSES